MVYHHVNGYLGVYAILRHYDTPKSWVCQASSTINSRVGWVDWRNQFLQTQQKVFIWLVVSNMFYFPFHIWDNPNPSDELIFSRWLLHHQPVMREASRLFAVLLPSSSVTEMGASAGHWFFPADGWSISESCYWDGQGAPSTSRQNMPYPLLISHSYWKCTI